MKLLDGTFGKLVTAAAGIEGRDALPVARQLPPQYGRSFARKMLASPMIWDRGWFGRIYIQ